MFYLWWDKADIVRSMSSKSWACTIKGIVNTIRPSFDKRAAMTLHDLTDIIEVCSRHDDLTPIRVAVTFAFCAFLRISNLAPPTAQTFDKSRHTTFKDVVPQDQGLVIQLKWTKTRQRTRDIISIPLPSLGDTNLCPVRAWRNYNRVLQLKGVTPDLNSPILLSTCDNPGRPLALPAVRRLFKKAVYLAHLQDVGYTPHSLRRGGATVAYHAGVPLDAIMRHGTWRSSAVESYLFAQPLFQTPVTTTFAKLLLDYQL